MSASCLDSRNLWLVQSQLQTSLIERFSCFSPAGVWSPHPPPALAVRPPQPPSISPTEPPSSGLSCLTGKVWQILNQCWRLWIKYNIIESPLMSTHFTTRKVSVFPSYNKNISWMIFLIIARWLFSIRQYRSWFLIQSSDITLLK